MSGSSHCFEARSDNLQWRDLVSSDLASISGLRFQTPRGVRLYKNGLGYWDI